MNTLLNKYLLYYPLTFLKGERVSHYLQEARKFQWLTKGEIESYQVNKLQNLIAYAIQNVPYYEKTLNPDSAKNITAISDLSSLPLISKENLINDFDALCSREKFFASTTKTTGGSTGQAVTLRKNGDALARERAVTARSYEWASVHMCEPQARLWGIPLEYENRLYYRVVDLVANRKRISAFNLNVESMKNYLHVLEKFQPKYLYGYASAIEEFTRLLHRDGRRLPSSIGSIICTSEVLTKELRENIQDYTGLDPFNEYGCGEVGSVAHECEARQLHIMSDNVIVELLDENGMPSTTGEIVVTDLFNYATPLIRYKLKDFGEFSAGDCSCGRQLPVLKKIHGRAYDFVIGKDGSKIHPELIMYLFEALKKEAMGIEQFQVVQKELDFFEIKLVVASDFDMAREPLLHRRLEELLGSDIRTVFQYLEKIPRETSGKLRLVKTEVSL